MNSDASTPDMRYFKDRLGLHPNWRFALRWPRRYLWLGILCRHKPSQLFLLKKWDCGQWLTIRRFLS